jgi:hypothetical protein
MRRRLIAFCRPELMREAYGSDVSAMFIDGLCYRCRFDGTVGASDDRGAAGWAFNKREEDMKTASLRELAPAIGLYAAGGHSAAAGSRWATVCPPQHGRAVVASDVFESGRPFTTALQVGQKLKGFGRLFAHAPRRVHIVPDRHAEVRRRYPAP